MNILEEYKDKLKDLQSKHKEELVNLQIEYAFKMAKYSDGDIVEDHIGRFRIVGMPRPWRSSYNNELNVRYSGHALTKKNEKVSRKADIRDEIYQENIIKLINNGEV